MEKGFNELFAKRTETIFNLILQFFFSWKRKMKSINIFFGQKFSAFLHENSFVEEKFILILTNVLVYNFLYLIFSIEDLDF